MERIKRRAGLLESLAIVLEMTLAMTIVAIPLALFLWLGLGISAWLWVVPSNVLDYSEGLIGPPPALFEREMVGLVLRTVWMCALLGFVVMALDRFRRLMGIWRDGEVFTEQSIAHIHRMGLYVVLFAFLPVIDVTQTMSWGVDFVLLGCGAVLSLVGWAFDEARRSVEELADVV